MAARAKALRAGTKAVRCWMVPFVKSQFYPRSSLRPVLSFFFTDLACNYRCHYCYASHTPEKKMSMDTARAGIDWLVSIGCRVLAIMGGEPLVRRDFIVEVTRYANSKGMYVYLPTNGYFLTERFVDQVAEAGVDMINLAVDCVEPIHGLPKALSKIRDRYEMLVRKSTEHRFLVMFNINITSKNAEDVKRLTAIAHRDHINVDYHILEPPMKKQPDFRTADNDLGFLPDDYRRVDDLLDWVIERFDRGYLMANSRRYLQDGKRFIRGEPMDWRCRAGQNTLVIGTDGRLAPCFEFFNDDHDWGTIGNPKFDPSRLRELKKQCNRKCFSTCNYTSSDYYTLSRAPEWVAKYLRIRR